MAAWRPAKPVLLLDWDGDVKYLNNRISEHMTFGSVLAEGELPAAVGLRSSHTSTKATLYRW